MEEGSPHAWGEKNCSIMNGFPLSSPHQNLGEAEPRDTGAKELVQPSAIDLC